MSKPEYHVASFSGGKDSTAMVCHMIERHDPLDEVVFCDTTMEFPAMLRHVERVKRYVEDAGVKFTTLKSKYSFEYWLLEYTPERKNPALEGLKGKSWAGPKTRWCTKHLKTELLDRYFRDLSEQYDVRMYVGIAADEQHRLERAQQKGAHKRYPLVDWRWDEADALAYCYAKGFTWDGLYETFRNEKTGKARVSCWCCPLQSLDELRKLRTCFPELWTKLGHLDAQTWRTFKDRDQSIKNLDKRFQLEDALTAEGHNIKNRAFHNDLKRLLAGETTIDGILQDRANE